jgi:hypothetical protein
MATVELTEVFALPQRELAAIDGVLLVETTLPFELLTSPARNPNKYRSSTNYSRVAFCDKGRNSA